MCQVVIKQISSYYKVVHEDLNKLPNHIKKDSHHASLKSCRCIGHAKWYPSVCVRSIRTHEHSLLLIFRSDINLIITKISVKKAVVFMTSQSFKHLVNERQ